jgi:hypothetical protein
MCRMAGPGSIGRIGRAGGSGAAIRGIRQGLKRRPTASFSLWSAAATGVPGRRPICCHAGAAAECDGKLGNRLRSRDKR